MIVVFDRDDLQLFGASRCPDRHGIADVTAEQSACERGHEGDQSRGWIGLVDPHDLDVPDLIALVPRRHMGAETDLAAIRGRRGNDSGGDALFQFQTTRAQLCRRELGSKELQTANGDVVGRALRERGPMADDHRLLGTVLLLREGFAHRQSIRRLL